MTDSAETGRRGEEAAVEYLRNNGFEISDCNWRAGRYEVDIVAIRHDEIHFVEVKSRRAHGLTAPEQAMTPTKCRAIMRAATAYMAQRGVDLEPRFDLISVDVWPDGRLDVRFCADAVESHW